MKWRKLGRVYVAQGESDWAQTHAYIPTPVCLGEVIRVYVAFLDKHRVGRIGFVDLQADNPLMVVNVSKRPVLDVGQPGTFDGSGVTPLCLINENNRRLLYYIGWQRAVDIPYCLFVGLAVSDDQHPEAFVRYSQVPLLDRSPNELFIRTASFVLNDDGLYKMWYVGGSRCIDVRGKKLPMYNLKYLESDNAYSWCREGIMSMEVSRSEEIGFGRPFVIRENNRYKMWYSVRTISKGYRLGYAESLDGVQWERKDGQVGIDVCSSGWDSEMICFASILDVKGQRYMFYNGNNYGETGFGLAVLER